jgi:hypothetical protein
MLLVEEIETDKMFYSGPSIMVETKSGELSILTESHKNQRRRLLQERENTQLITIFTSKDHSTLSLS